MNRRHFLFLVLTGVVTIGICCESSAGPLRRLFGHRPHRTACCTSGITLEPTTIPDGVPLDWECCWLITCKDGNLIAGIGLALDEADALALAQQDARDQAEMEECEIESEEELYCNQVKRDDRPDRKSGIKARCVFKIKCCDGINVTARSTQTSANNACQLARKVACFLAAKHGGAASCWRRITFVYGDEQADTEA